VSANNDNFESVVLHASNVVTGSALVPGTVVYQKELCPAHVLIALHHFVSVSGVAPVRGAMYKTILAQHGVAPEEVWAYAMDTTAVNPASLTVEDWKHTTFIGCAAHVADLTLEDMMQNAAFKKLHSSITSLSTWFHGSPKRKAALLRIQTGTAQPVLTITSSNTRFGQFAIVLSRIVRLWDNLALLFTVSQDEARVGDYWIPDNASTFTEMWCKIVPLKATILAVNDMIKPFLAISPRLGSNSEYTMSLHTTVWRYLIGVAKPFLSSEIDEVKSFAETLTVSSHSEKSGVRNAFITVPTLSLADSLVCAHGHRRPP
jgi:hypothetical protein